jgi:quercetin dioxygenase-like cupin family protein
LKEHHFTDITTSPGPREEVTFIFEHEIKKCPGFSVVGIQIDYPPGGFTPPHRHGGAQVMAVITEGEMLSGMNGNPPEVYSKLQSFLELPGCHHTVGQNNSQTERTKAIVVYVVETEVLKSGHENLMLLDEGWE